MVEDTTKAAAASGAIGGAVGAGAAGLGRAAEVAGGILRGIFGGLPWDMDPGAIVNAVAGRVADAVPVVVDAIGVVPW